MMPPDSAERGMRWEAEGRRTASALDAASAAVVAGASPLAAARVALGIAMEQTARRRVTIVDLAGELPPLQSLVTGDDAHGVSDAFTFGISLNRLARPTGVEPNLFIIPSGAEPVIHDHVLASPRWAALVRSTRSEGALLLFVAQDDAPQLAALAAMTDGVVAVGDGDAVRALPRVLATVGAARRTPANQRPPRVITPMSRRNPWPWVGAALVALAVAGAVWAVRDRRERAAARVLAVRETPAAPAIEAPPAPPADTVPPLVVANPGDSARAAAFGVEVMAANTEVGAQLTLMENANYLSAPTIVPMQLTTDGARWYKLFAGAYATRRSADSALRQLRRRAVVSDSAGSVARVPLAMRLTTDVPRDSVARAIASWQARGISAYALLQADGRATVYAGAFSAPRDAELLATILREADATPTLVYRTGRVF